MEEGLYKNKFRIPSARLPNWDYGAGGIYFVTICTKNRQMYFGDVNYKNGEMILNNLGQIAQECWQAIPDHFPFVRLGAYCIMPNHVHGIIVIDKSRLVETQDIASLQSRDNFTLNRFGPQSRNLASIIRGFKIGVTKYARKNNINFSWQPRYYDQIIWDENSMQNIYKYIKNNPYNWLQERNNPAGLLM